MPDRASGFVRPGRDPVRAAERRAKVATLVATFSVIEFRQLFAERWADVVGALRSAGTPIPFNDAQVAATALGLGFGLLVGPADEELSSGGCPGSGFGFCQADLCDRAPRRRSR